MVQGEVSKITRQGQRKKKTHLPQGRAGKLNSEALP